MTPAPAICEGATGATVRWAQYLLAGLTLSCNQIDGIFGPVTKTPPGDSSATATSPSSAYLGAG
jgi:hypothetical protein